MIQPKNEQNIAIIGGGPGGLMLALLLQQKGIKATIFERDLSDQNNARGGSLDIHENTGQLALKEAGLYEQFLSKARFEGEDFRLFDKNGTIYLDDVAEASGDRPEIDRGELCNLLLEKLDKNCIQYGYRLQKGEILSNGQTALYFENGEKIVADLVIGSDGTFSRVRSLLTQTDVSYSGLTMVELNIENAAIEQPALATFNKRGKVFALDQERGILGQLNGNGTIKVYACLKTDYNWLQQFPVPFEQTEKVKETLLTYFKDWYEPLTDYIQKANGEILPRRIYMLPIGFKWPRQKNITLIGDAAHAMSPFAGEGVNMALHDAYNLAMALTTNEENPEQAIAQYEEKMYAYSSEAAEQSSANLDICFSKNAAPKLKKLMDSFHA